jgi:hypothetical protein
LSLRAHSPCDAGLLRLTSAATTPASPRILCKRAFVSASSLRSLAQLRQLALSDHSPENAGCSLCIGFTEDLHVQAPHKFSAGRVCAQQPQPAQTKPYLVEWVYRVKYGYQDEWWKIFQKYQITTLDKEKDLGYVTSYQVVRPGLHTSEDSRWDYRIVIAYKDESSAGHGGEVEKSLFPDADKRKQEENRRWELTTNHWDLPIKEVDPHTTE